MLELEHDFRNMSEADDLGILDLFFCQSLLRGGLLDTDGLAVEIFYFLIFVRICLLDDDKLFCRQVVVREIHRFLTFISWIDTSDGDIDLTAGERGQKCLEIHILHFELDAELVSDFLCKFHINADDFLFTDGRIDEFIWRVTGRGAHDELAFFLDLLHQRAFFLRLRFARCRFVTAAAAARQGECCHSCQTKGSCFPCFAMFHHHNVHLSSEIVPIGLTETLIKSQSQIS